MGERSCLGIVWVVKETEEECFPIFLPCILLIPLAFISTAGFLHWKARIGVCVFLCGNIHMHTCFWPQIHSSVSAFFSLICQVIFCGSEKDAQHWAWPFIFLSEACAYNHTLQEGCIRVQNNTKYSRFSLLSQATSIPANKGGQGQFSGPADKWNTYVCLNCILPTKQAGLGLF